MFNNIKNISNTIIAETLLSTTWVFQAATSQSLTDQMYTVVPCSSPHGYLWIFLGNWIKCIQWSPTLHSIVTCGSFWEELTHVKDVCNICSNEALTGALCEVLYMYILIMPIAASIDHFVPHACSCAANFCNYGWQCDQRLEKYLKPRHDSFKGKDFIQVGFVGSRIYCKAKGYEPECSVSICLHGEGLSSTTQLQDQFKLPKFINISDMKGFIKKNSLEG